MTKAINDLVAKEMADYGITGVSIALVDDQKIVYSQAYGDATKESLFRVGSISKLFNAVSIMQLVEKGQIDLDAPLSRYAGAKWGMNPFPGGPEPTLRQVLCHRSGLPREASCGGYFDGEQPSLDATIDSMVDCPLATAPNAKTRYSNIGIALSEKDRRRYAAVEAEKLGRGGVRYISELFGCDPNTIRVGAYDLENLPNDDALGRIRKKGGPQAS